MRTRPLSPETRLTRGWLLAALLVGMAALAFVAVRMADPPRHSADSGGHPTSPDLDSREPAVSFDTVRHVTSSGGSPLAREAAIAWLDQQAREGMPLPQEAETHLLAMLHHAEGHPSWSSSYRQHIFNSACNALRVRLADSGESLARILLSHATTHPDRILRLYALQHIGLLKNSGRLDGPLAEEIQSALEALAASAESGVAGTAITLLAAWNGPGQSAPAAVEDLAATTAADRSQSVDVRITALQAAGAAALEVSRSIAPDHAEPIILRKAAIARIGRHGGEEDLAVLSAIRTESSRLAQAAVPALKAIRTREGNPPAPRPLPYQ